MKFLQFLAVLITLFVIFLVFYFLVFKDSSVKTTSTTKTSISETKTFSIIDYSGEKDLSSETYICTLDDTEYSMKNIILPQITDPESSSITLTNNEIKLLYLNLYRTFSEYRNNNNDSFIVSDYIIQETKNIFSIIIKVTNYNNKKFSYTYYTYTFDKDSKKLLEYKDLPNYIDSVPSGDLISNIREKVESNKAIKKLSKEEKNEYIEKIINEVKNSINNSTFKFYIGRSNSLHVIVNIITPDNEKEEDFIIRN